MSATFNENTGILTITSATNSDTTPEPIMPGNVETLINTDPELSLLFQVGNFIAGVPIPLSVEPVPFVGGVDPINI